MNTDIKQILVILKSPMSDCYYLLTCILYPYIGYIGTHVLLMIV